MGRILDLAEGLWSGSIDPAVHHPFTPLLDVEEVAPRTGFVSSFANATAFDTDGGLVLVDTGSFLLSAQVHTHVRAFTPRPLHTAVYTHGHVDHCFGVERYEAEGSPARVIAHERVPARFERYRLTAGYNACINARQFGTRADWPLDYRAPDVVYAQALDVDVGGERFELRHAQGETDDATWVWVPSRAVVCVGDLFIWATPNAGNPQKVQRYPREWARALRLIAELPAEVLCPGHGPPILGRDRIRRALTETATLLESIVEQTLAVMNAGGRLDDALASVKAPPELLARPYLRPVYDEPEFIVRSTWRLYGGWWDGDPSHLKPARATALATELASLAGGPEKLADRAAALADAGDFALACHLAETAWLAAPGDDAITAVRADVYTRRARAETSLMARGIFRAAAKPAEEEEDP
ncbi:MAG TPA: alkyl sulfatase dimerization domain-containing protein [Polyangiaceae bacterium]|jgi:alkyl sulfatase BDS1-like metallo-beta-lactamase superfamily hydrolase